MRIDLFFYSYYGWSRIRAKILRLFTGFEFKSVGRNLKFFGASSMELGQRLSLGDNCWLHAIGTYKGVIHSPLLTIGDDVSFSDAVHISCISKITIGSGTLIGSGVYIGDHSHGSTHLSQADMETPPALRSLSDAAPIYIGDNVWIGDGVRILAGSIIPSGSIVGANSVVNAAFSVPGIIAGLPAVLKRSFIND